MTITVDTLDWKDREDGGQRAFLQFKNGYGASVLHGNAPGAYTKNGTFEIAVIKGDDIDYTTPVTDDVLGYLSKEEANATLEKIANLPGQEGDAS